MNVTTPTPVKTVRIIPAKIDPFQTNIIQKQLRVAAYCRVSTKMDEQHLSYETQKEFYTDKIMKNPEWRFAGIYADKGITGTMVKKRKDFLKMIEHCKQGRIDLIITKSVKRFARNTIDCLKYVRLLKSLGIGVIFELEGIDTRHMESEFMLTIHSSMAQGESETNSSSIKWGKQKSYAKGRVSISYKSFLGYRKNEDGNTEIDPEEAKIVTRIYDEFLTGKSRQKIADDLTADGIPTPRNNKKWWSSTIHSILTNEKYIGDALLQKTYIEDCLTHKSKINNGELPQYYVEDNHPAIISKSKWNKVQEEIARRASKRKVKEKGTITELGKYSSKYALTELLVCGNCGTPYRRVTWSKKKTGSSAECRKKIVWRCISRLDYGTKYCKTSPSIEESMLQNAILSAIEKQIQSKTDAMETLRLHVGMGMQEKDSDDNIYSMEERVKNLRAGIGELISITDVENTAQNEQKITALCSEIKELEEKIRDKKSSEIKGSMRQDELNELFDTMKEMRNKPLIYDETIIRQFISCIKVMSKDKLIIYFQQGNCVEVDI